MSDQPRVLAIHAHPDDVEILCAGTLLRLRDHGCAVSVVTMTPGDKGSAEHSAEEIAKIRRGEAAAAAALLGADYRCLEFRDLQIDVNDESRRRVTEAIRRTRPDVVITAPPVDYMTDHEHTSRLVRDACFCASVPNYKTEQWDPAEPTERIPNLYYCDPVEGVDWYGQPVPYDVIVDVSDQIDRKIEMLACHASQREWLRRQHGEDEYLDSARRWGARRGEAVGYESAEAFRQHNGHPYPHSDRLSELLGLKTG